MQHAKSKPLSETAVFFQSLVGFAIAALVMVGFGGTVYKLVAPDGWFAQLLGRSVAGGLAALLAFMVIGLCVWLTRGWVSISGRNRYSALFVYVFAGAGALYAAQMLIGK
jgi:hypothetical protein